jgi:putative solute:sodium symporter small subunit
MPELSDATRAAQRRYWRANVAVMTVLLLIWAFVGLGCGILWADWLNQWQLGGVPLGFWFAQQGSIATFVVLILVYAIVMNALDAKYHREVGRHPAAEGGTADERG